ncbi:MAG: hypothetical protein ACNA7U_02725 [Candidatus Izemoplasmataceae bacterium]
MRKFYLLSLLLIVFLLSACGLLNRSEKDLETVINDYQSGNYTMNYQIQNEHVNFGQSIRYFDNDTFVQEDFNEKMTLYLTGLRHIIYDEYDRELSDKVRQLIPIITSTILISPTWMNDLFEIPLADNEHLTFACFEEHDSVYTLKDTCFNLFTEAYVFTLYYQIEDFLLVMYDGSTSFKSEFFNDATILNRYLDSVMISIQEDNIRFEMVYTIDDYELSFIFNTFDLNKTSAVDDDTDISWINHYHIMLFENGVYTKFNNHLSILLNAVNTYCESNDCLEDALLNSNDLSAYISNTNFGSYLVKILDNENYLVAYELYNIRYVGNLVQIDNEYIVYKNHPLYQLMAFTESALIFPVLP